MSLGSSRGILSNKDQQERCISEWRWGTLQRVEQWSAFYAKTGGAPLVLRNRNHVKGLAHLTTFEFNANMLVVHVDSVHLSDLCRTFCKPL